MRLFLIATVLAASLAVPVAAEIRPDQVAFRELYKELVETNTSDGGASMKMLVSSALQRALLVMLTDVSSPFPRDDNSKSAADGYFPFMNRRIQVVGYSLGENSDWIAFSPKIIGTSLLAGVNIMDKSVTKIRPATKDDRRIGASSQPY